MEKAQDLRVTKTYKALFEAFMALLSEKQFENITVLELCEKAMVRRATFYKHFADKYEFFTFFIRVIKDQFEAESIPFLTEEKPQEYFIRMTRKLIGFLSEHRGMVSSIKKSDMLPMLSDILSEQIVIIAKERFVECSKKGYALLAPPEFLASFYAGGLMQVLHRRLSSKILMADDDVMAEIEKILNSFFT